MPGGREGGREGRRGGGWVMFVEVDSQQHTR